MKEHLVPYTGQKYECKVCGECCHNRIIPLTKNDLDRLQRIVGDMDFAEYLINIQSFVLSHREWDGGCVLQNDMKCSIHDQKPVVCRLFPFASYPKPFDGSTNNAYKLPDGTIVYIYIDTACPGVETTEKAPMPIWLIPLIQRIRLEMALTRFFYEGKENNRT
ncbi:MAG: YkgJ family cysteine cluster protein [Candidatus Methanofastidiosia archaeon]